MIGNKMLKSQTVTLFLRYRFSHVISVHITKLELPKFIFKKITLCVIINLLFLFHFDLFLKKVEGKCNMASVLFQKNVKYLKLMQKFCSKFKV